MIRHPNISSFVRSAWGLIASDKVAQAIDLVLDWIEANTDDREPLYHMIVISSEYRLLKNSYDRGNLGFDEFCRLRRKLLFQVLILIEEISAGHGSTPAKWASGDS